MTIALNFIALPEEKGSGAFRYIQMLLQAMGNYDLPDCEFVVYKQRQISKEYIGIPSSLNVRYVDVPKLGSGLKRIIFEQTFFYHYLEKHDVLYSYCTSMPLLARCKKIFTLHDVYYLTNKERYGWLQRTYLSLMTRLYCRCCDRILTVSQYSKAEIEKYLAVEPDKLAVTYNFVLPKERHQEKPAMTDYNGEAIDYDVPFFFYLGNLQPGKNIAGMINGFVKYLGKRRDVQLILAGKPTTAGAEIVESIRNVTNVHYLGYISRAEVDWLLSRCIAVVLLSFCEGFGIPPIEGFYYGRPALVSNAASLPEVVGKAGILVNPHEVEEIANGFEDIEMKKDCFGEETIRQLQKFSPKSSVEMFMNCLGIKFFEK